MKNVLFIDYIPITSKDQINGGGQIRRYYAWNAVNSIASTVISFRKRKGGINWRNIISILNEDHVIWVEYRCGGIAHLFALLLSLNRSKKLILNIHDLSTQQRDFDKNAWIVKRIRLSIVEKLLLERADVIILAWPKLLDYFKPNTDQKIQIMPPGVGEDEFFISTPAKANVKKTAIYFGSMRRKGFIPKIIELFSGLNDWELQLIGPKEGENIFEKNNVKYMGSVSHNKLMDIVSKADVILIPLPRNEYTDKFVPIKIGYVLKTCKPVIVTKLRGISEFISMCGLDDNVIYLNEWNADTLKEALHKAESINIDINKTFERLKPLAWEPRFKKAVNIAFDDIEYSDQIIWL